MNLYLKCEEFEKYLVKMQEILGGIQYRFKFDNKYGASVVKHSGSYGHEQDLWELAVIWYSHPEKDIWYLSTQMNQNRIAELYEVDKGTISRYLKAIKEKLK